MIVTLKEFGEHVIRGATPSPTFEDLRRRLSEYVTIEYRADGVAVRARQFIGYIPLLPNLSLRVTPKFLRNDWDFFYMLDVAGIVPRLLSSPPVAVRLGQSNASRINEMLVREFLGCLQLIRRDGILKRYVEQCDVRHAVKGKIDVTATVRELHSHSRLDSLKCHYFDSTADLVENRAIRLAIARLLAQPVLSRPTAAALRRAARDFGQIQLVPREDVVNAVRQVLTSGRTPQNRDYYRRALSLSMLILERAGVELPATGSEAMTPFTLNMDDVFERYVRAVLQRHLAPRGLEVFKGDKSANKKTLFDNAAGTLITPDIIIRQTGQIRFVGDMKYIAKPPGVDEFYQVISYALSYRCNTVALIVPTEEDQPALDLKVGAVRVVVLFYNLRSLPAAEVSLQQFVDALL